MFAMRNGTIVLFIPVYIDLCSTSNLSVQLHNLATCLFWPLFQEPSVANLDRFYCTFFVFFSYNLDIYISHINFHLISFSKYNVLGVTVNTSTIRM
jgi:hypothetical protein